MIQLRGPGATAVERNIGAAVVGLDHDVSILRIDPDVVIVAMRGAKDRKRLAAVGGFKESFRAGVDHVGVCRVSAEGDVIKWPLNHRRSDRSRLWIHRCPTLPCIIRTIQSTARFCFNQRIDPIRFRGCDGKICLANQFVRQSGYALREVLAAVGALVEAAVARTADDRPGFAFEVRHPGVNNTGITGLQLDIHCAYAIRNEQNLAPSLSAVRGFEDAALSIRFESVALRRDPNDVRISRMNANASNLARVVEADEFPCQPTVGRFVHATSGRDVAAHIVRARAQIDHVRI